MARLAPFPGMAPWIEARWTGFHQWLIIAVGEQLNDVLPEQFVARVEERVFVGYSDGTGRLVMPDVSVVEDNPRRDPSPAGASGTAVVDEPLLVHLSNEPVTEGDIQIVDAGDEATVVTAVEVLSPTNKSDAHGRRPYLAKRDEYHRARVSTVEIDLLRGGEPTVVVPPGMLAPGTATPYRVCVQRGWQLADQVAEYYPISLRSKLPRFRVPLRQSDPDVVLDLQAAFERAYRNGRYDRTNYDRPPVPPLSPDDAAWAREQVERWRQAR